MRDLRRHLQDIPEGSLRERIIAKLALVSQLLHQQPKGADKIYALHEPEVDGISKGKARVRSEFGCKVSVANTLDEGFVVGMRSFAGNAYDGHTLKEALEQVTILTDQRPDLAVVDRGYRSHGETKIRVLISGTRRGLTSKLIADLRRRSAIEAEIGHMKTDGRLSRSPLNGTIGDALFAAPCACGHNFRKILAHLRAWLAWMSAVILNAAYPRSPVSGRHISLNALFMRNSIAFLDSCSRISLAFIDASAVNCGWKLSSNTCKPACAAMCSHL